MNANRRHILLYTFLLSLLPVGVWGQGFTLTGSVTDEEGAALPLSTVRLSGGGVAFTNLKGEYSIKGRTADSVVVTFSMIGYRQKRRVLRRPRGRLTLRVQLFPDNTLSEVTVTERRRQTTGEERLSREDMLTVGRAASATGNAVEDMIQTQGGVTTHSELSSQYNVRGGAFDENLVYINGVEVYRPLLVRSGQQEGLSVINPDMVESVTFSTGGYGAKYGDRMSSVLDIAYRRPRRTEASLSASLLGGSAYVGLAGKRLSWSNGLRYKTTRALLGGLDTNGEYRPNFLDYQTYLVFTPNESWEISLLGNISENHYNFRPRDRETAFGTEGDVKNFRVYFDGQERDLFRTFFGTLSVRRRLSPGTSLSLLASAFNSRESEAYDIQGQYWLDQSETSENLGVGTYMEHTRNRLTSTIVAARALLERKTRSHDILAGLGVRSERVRERSREYEYRDSAGYSVPHTGEDLQMIYTLTARNRLSATRYEAFFQDSWRWQGGQSGEREASASRDITRGADAPRPQSGDNLHSSLFTSRPQGVTLYTLSYGLRFARWSYNGEAIVSPRVSLAIVPGRNEDVTWRFAAGLYYQAPLFKELRDTLTEGGVTYARLNANIRSQRAIHLIAAYDRRFRLSGKRLRFTAEAYYKLLSRLVPYSVSNVKTVYYGTNEASGHAAGLDMKLYGEFVPGAPSWLSFSLMDTRMRLNGRSVPLPTDQRYAFNLFFTDYFPGTDRLRLSLKLAFADGLPFAAPHRGVEENSFRAPAYKRCDIGMAFRAIAGRQRGVRNLWLGVDCLNLFAGSNVNSYYWVTDIAGAQYAVPNYLTGRQLNFKVQVEI